MASAVQHQYEQRKKLHEVRYFHSVPNGWGWTHPHPHPQVKLCSMNVIFRKISGDNGIGNFSVVFEDFIFKAKRANSTCSWCVFRWINNFSVADQASYTFCMYLDFFDAKIYKKYRLCYSSLLEARGYFEII